MIWPDDALERVAKLFLGQTDIEAQMTELCVAMCKHFHVSVQKASDKFYEEQKRKTYVTPTSYLELIQTFKDLYYLKVEQITLQRNRYETGLEKLDFAAGQVGLMQQELYDLQPKLVVASAKTEKLMIKIEQDTVVVEAKKEVTLHPTPLKQIQFLLLPVRLLELMKLWLTKPLRRRRPSRMIVNLTCPKPFLRLKLQFRPWTP